MVATGGDGLEQAAGRKGRERKPPGAVSLTGAAVRSPPTPTAAQSECVRCSLGTRPASARPWGAHGPDQRDPARGPVKQGKVGRSSASETVAPAKILDLSRTGAAARRAPMLARLAGTTPLSENGMLSEHSYGAAS